MTKNLSHCDIFRYCGIKYHKDGYLEGLCILLPVYNASFIGLDSTPILANTKQNNPKSFVKNKFDPKNQPKADADCALGVHTASNQHNERNFEFYWGYKNHVLVDCITGLPIGEITTPADVADSTVALDILKKTNTYLSVEECTFIGDNANRKA